MPYLRSVLTLSLITLSMNFAHASQFCKDLVTSHSETPVRIENQKSLDQEYLDAKSQRPTGHQHQVTTLLNRAFFPMIEKLAQTVDGKSLAQLKEEAAYVESQHPILDGTFYRVTGNTVINGWYDKRIDRFETKLTTLVDNAAMSFFKIYPSHAYSSKQEFQQKNHLHQNLLALTPNQKRRESIGKLHDWFSATITPVGEYGRKFSEDLMITTQVLSALAERNLVDTSKSLASDAPSLILHETGRGLMASSEGIRQDVAPLSSLIEGILSFHQLLTLTLSEKIPGIETGHDALKAFIFSGKSENGLTSALVKRLPLAVVGPMANAGVTFKGSFVLTPEGKLEISDQLKDALTKYQTRAGKSARPRRVCPMSLFFQGKNPFTKNTAEESMVNQKTGLQNLAETYWKIFEIVSKERQKN
jgi:hypothetical protein